jgi:hypothetical protein
MKVEKDPIIAHAEAESVALPIELGAQTIFTKHNDATAPHSNQEGMSPDLWFQKLVPSVLTNTS